MHPLLLPGTHLLRRDARSVQAGLDPTTAVVLDSPARDLGEIVRDDAAARRLSASGLLCRDDQAFRSALPPHGSTEPWARHSVAALARRSPEKLSEALARRRRHSIVVTTFGHPLGRQLADDVTRICRRAGLPLPPRARPGPRPRGSVDPQPVHVLVGVGEPPRDLVDRWLHERVPHLLVRLVEGRAVLGPLTVPGQHACLRCIDAYLTEGCPSWPLLVEQYSRATRDDRPDGVPEPVDATLAAVAAGWAARDLSAFVDGTSPPTCLSTTVVLAPELDSVETRTWPRHPECGCGWT